MKLNGFPFVLYKEAQAACIAKYFDFDIYVQFPNLYRMLDY
jgi:hypothetical protein